ncbi:DUF192 domain-containing protein [Thioalkalivibrio sp. ALE23]|uniref:DUF192 domain-containing protein n=1 Tax=Thioalkalivibrio sp. ALE23 TaxID=1265495 RepID=UPI00036E4569
MHVPSSIYIPWVSILVGLTVGLMVGMSLAIAENSRSDVAKNTPGDLPTLPLEVGDRTLTVELAASPESQRRGLMHRQSLPDDHGMLFLWDNAGPRAMWMKNTLIPLDVAFIDAEGVITNIETMQPETTRQHESAGPVPYALEVHAGWFEEHGIEAGERIPDLDRSQHEGETN